MRYPQLLVYENDRRLAEALRPAVKSRKWSLREPRGLESCLRLLKGGGPAVLVLKLGKDLILELTILERVAWLAPGTAVVVIGDTENAALECLAWDLGATLVLFPPRSRQGLAEIVITLLGHQSLSRSSPSIDRDAWSADDLQSHE